MQTDLSPSHLDSKLKSPSLFLHPVEAAVGYTGCSVTLALV